MRTAKTTVAALYVDCPNCGEPIEETGTGSHLWNANDSTREKTLTCNACGEVCKTPKRLYNDQGQTR
jgi:uncharacterized Zn finger protein